MALQISTAAVQIRDLSVEIRTLMKEGDERKAYDKLEELNDILSDLAGITVEMRGVIGANK